MEFTSKSANLHPNPHNCMCELTPMKFRIRMCEVNGEVREENLHEGQN